uniref:Uncharacterized protein n=1 Tax=Candida bohioensis TaxID=561986 RepID=U3MLL4_9ASCO|nr:hypothetical protein [Candida bohioensis]AGW07360.1 hypothetical protein [Candida bohioensis]
MYYIFINNLIMYNHKYMYEYMLSYYLRYTASTTTWVVTAHNNTYIILFRLLYFMYIEMYTNYMIIFNGYKHMMMKYHHPRHTLRYGVGQVYTSNNNMYLSYIMLYIYT